MDSFLRPAVKTGVNTMGKSISDYQRCFFYFILLKWDEYDEGTKFKNEENRTGLELFKRERRAFYRRIDFRHAEYGF